MNGRSRLAEIRRHLAVWRQAVSQAVSRETQFRAQAIATVGVGLLELVLAMVPILLLFSFTSELNGWSAGQAVALVGFYQIVSSVLATFVAPNLGRMHAYVTEGELDQVLVRPVSSQLFVTSRWLAPAELTGVVSGLAVVIVGLWRAEVTPTVGGALLAFAWLVIGILLITCLWSNLAYLEFRIQASGPLGELLADVMAAGRYPVSFFPRAAQSLLMVVVPIGVATTVPVRALTGAFDVMWLPVGVLALIVAGFVTRWHWNAAVQRYSSASS